jgi:hypothetical protein
MTQVRYQNQQNGRRNYEVRSGAAASLTNCSMIPILASRPLMQPVRSPMQRLRPSRRPSTDASRCSVGRALSSPVFSGSRQRMRWCSSVCFPELRSRSGTPSASHALHMKRSSKRAAWTVISQVKKSSLRPTFAKNAVPKWEGKTAFALATCWQVLLLALTLCRV